MVSPYGEEHVLSQGIYMVGVTWRIYNGNCTGIYIERIKQSKQIMSSRLLSKNFKIKIYRTIILPVVLYGCETWSLTLREGRRLRVFKNRVLRRVFEPKRDEVTWEWRHVHNEELNDLYSFPNIVRNFLTSCKVYWLASQEGLCSMQ